MSGDLEDFLRRAAQRRQAKASQPGGASPPPARNKPEYSDSRTERTAGQEAPDVTRTPSRTPPDARADAPIIAAEVVDATTSDSHAAILQRAEDAKRAADQSRKEEASKAKETERKRAAAARGAALNAAGNPAYDLIKLIRRPGGIQQAILLREILDRPEHRW